MKDKFYNGLLYGVLAGVILNIFNLVSYYFDVISLRYLDWMAILLYGTKPYNALDGGFALLMQIGLCGILGVLFVYILPVIGFEHHSIKGMVFGLSVFQTTYIVTTLFRVPELVYIPPYTAMGNSLGSALFGAILAVLIKKRVYKKV